jgi:hypothetical protein
MLQRQKSTNVGLNFGTTIPDSTDDLLVLRASKLWPQVLRFMGRKKNVVTKSRWRDGDANYNNSWKTPDWLMTSLTMELGNLYDPCPLNPKPDFDGLQESWAGKKVYCNPPYSNILPWVEKALASEAELVVMLLPTRSESEWFHKLWRHRHRVEFRFFRKRVTFAHADPTKAGGKAHPVNGLFLAIILPRT